jgi:hypothetical protein
VQGEFQHLNVFILDAAAAISPDAVVIAAIKKWTISVTPPGDI